MNKIRMTVCLALVCAGYLLASGNDLTNNDSKVVVLSSTSERIQYVGRFSDDFCFGWSGSTMRVKFNGTDLLAKVKLVQGGKGGLQVVIDGKPNTEKLYITKDQDIYVIASDLEPGEHTVELVKTGEGYISEMCLEEFSLPNGGEFLPIDKRDRQIMVLGDSITCGYANEILDRNTGNNVTNQNAYFTYGQVAGRELNADVTMICQSGYGIFRNRSMQNDQQGVIPKIFDRTLPRNSKLKYDFSLADPDVISINLGTNDKANGDKKGELQKDDYIGASTNFINQLEVLYPNAKIIVSIGPMYRGDDVVSWLKEIAASNPKVYFLLYGKMSDPDDIAGHWHPSVKMHKKMGKTLQDKIVEITGWK
jgi:lysophospholipase L1-like esterase